ncbi:hypothetical protein C1H76_5555 [Elsinoe australis]|uniref:Uncharacterized protein n=1 Tax=Elsinoe australis TaxID=40998 RepID=A0A4U7AYC1_9PEZI|nr:hypothetical protein C1H76_5555 [Elsinoe australis]
MALSNEEKEQTITWMFLESKPAPKRGLLYLQDDDETPEDGHNTELRDGDSSIKKRRLGLCHNKESTTMNDCHDSSFTNTTTDNVTDNAHLQCPTAASAEATFQPERAKRKRTRSLERS